MLLLSERGIVKSESVKKHGSKLSVPSTAALPDWLPRLVVIPPLELNELFLKSADTRALR